jgi:thiol-disulfide isomerase/thioredoxin
MRKNHEAWNGIIHTKKIITLLENEIVCDHFWCQVVLDISSKTCGPCRRIYPMVVQLSIEYPDVIFLKINGDRSINTSRVRSPQSFFLCLATMVVLVSVECQLQQSVNYHYCHSWLLSIGDPWLYYCSVQLMPWCYSRFHGLWLFNHVFVVW